MKTIAKSRRNAVKRLTTTRDLIVKVRELTGLSVAQIAQLVGVDRQTVWKWQQGAPAREHHVEDLRRILRRPDEARELTARAKRGLLHLASVAGLLTDLRRGRHHANA